MKKIILVSFLIVSAVIISNAQYFVGGSIGFNHYGGKLDNGTTSVDKTSGSTFSFAPKGGMFLSDKIMVGLQLSIASSNVKTPGMVEQVDRAKVFGIMPFGRYYAFRLNKIALFAQGNFGLAFGSEESTVGSTTTEGPKTTAISFNIFPGISYDLNEMISLEASLNGLNIGISNVTEKLDDNKETTTNIGLGASLNNIATTGAITIGAIIKF